MKRCIALTIGIDIYAHNKKLSCAENDARAVEQKLRQLKFETYSLYNQQATLQNFNEIKARISDALYYNKIDAFVFYFAGHGKMFNATDCLILYDTEDISDNNKTKIRAQSIDLKDFCDYLRGAGDQMIIVIIDACRPNGEESVRGDLISTAKDFGKNTTLPYQSFLAFSTSPGTSAYEPVNGEHSKFTAALLEELPKAQSIETTFKEIRKKVYQLNGNMQIPCETSCLVDDFSFNYGQLDPRTVAGYTENAYDYANYLFVNCAPPDFRDVQDIYEFILGNIKNINSDEAFVLGAKLGDRILHSPSASEYTTTTKLKSLNKDTINGFLYALYYTSDERIREEYIPKWLLNLIMMITKEPGFADSKEFIHLFDELYGERLYLPGDKTQKSITINLKKYNGSITAHEDELYEISSITCEGEGIKRTGIDTKQLYTLDSLKRVLRLNIEVPDFLLNIKVNTSVANEQLISPVRIDQMKSSTLTHLINSHQEGTREKCIHVQTFEQFMNYAQWEELSIEEQNALYDVLSGSSPMDMGLFYTTTRGENILLFYKLDNVCIRLTPSRKRYFVKWLEDKYMGGEMGDVYFSLAKSMDED